MRTPVRYMPGTGSTGRYTAGTGSTGPAQGGRGPWRLHDVTPGGPTVGRGTARFASAAVTSSTAAATSTTTNTTHTRKHETSFILTTFTSVPYRITRSSSAVSLFITAENVAVAPHRQLFLRNEPWQLLIAFKALIIVLLSLELLGICSNERRVTSSIHLCSTAMKTAFALELTPQCRCTFSRNTIPWR